MLELVNTNRPRFSIVIPTYNATDMLRQCIKSLSDQSADKKCIEVIVVNDGGKTDISEILDFLEGQLQIRYFYQENKGPAAARNLGIKKAKGEIILFLDDDSQPAPDWLEAMMRAWEKFPDFDGIGGYTLSEATDSIYCRVNSDFFNWFLRQYAYDKISPFLATCNAGYRKALLTKVGNFDERFKKAAGEERDLNIKISKTGGKLGLVESILVYHDRDLTLQSFAKKHYNYGKAAYDIYARNPDLKHLSRNAYASLYLSILGRYRTHKEKIIVFFLLTLSQVSTLIGYYSAFLTRKN